MSHEVIGGFEHRVTQSVLHFRKFIGALCREHITEAQRCEKGGQERC